MANFSDFAQHMDWAGLIDLLLSVAAILLCLTVHETCHGLAAWALGDPTAKRLHRLSLNPIRHIDPFGALMMLVAGFGWAKPVPVDPRYFRKPKLGMAVTALAGPVSNLVMAYMALLLRAVLLAFYHPGSALLEGLVGFCETLAVLNVGLGIFNLIPFPPLDGSKVLGAFLPDRAYFQLMRYERWGMLLLMVLLWLGVFSAPLSAARTWVLDLLVRGAAWPYYLLT
ncbi:site-2 protease family protein [Intestinimonas timonensis]|uniref:site-2 protease family protein n=1 Tax=Intestinimonas timonensis TaxID=1689270 RepID=UPI0023F33A82|nr:site-2 protease family protein [Intestinimonas timonensis]